MNYSKNIPYYLAAFILFVGFKFVYIKLHVEDLLFLLAPIQFLTGLFTGSTSFYNPEVGYVFSDLGISITKECSGFQFWMLTFLIFSCVSINHVSKGFRKSAVIFAALLVSYVLTLVANTSRIIISIFSKSMFITLGFDEIVAHEVLGTVIHLIFLVSFYLLAHYLLTKNNFKNEELTQS